MSKKPTKMEIRQWPGGVPTMVNMKRCVSRRRPWQDKNDSPTLCAFCNGPVVWEAEYDRVRVTKNFDPVYAKSMIVVSKVHGEEVSVTDAFSAVHCFMEKAGDYWLGVKRGVYAGQTVEAHDHYHLVHLVSRELRRAYLTLGKLRSVPPCLEIVATDAYKIFAGGHRTGQCIITPTGKMLDVAAMEETFLKLKELFDLKFRTRCGMFPEYQFAMSLSDRKIRYATFIPVLSQPGFEHSMALLEGREIMLAWPHEKTAEFLRR
jgi:hypothetical protein